MILISCVTSGSYWTIPTVTCLICPTAKWVLVAQLGWGLGDSISLHLCLLWHCLWFLAAWSLGPRVSIPSNLGRSCMAFPNPFSEVTQHHFCYVLFVGSFTDPRRFEGRWLSFRVLVELLQSQCKKTTWLGNTVASVFGKCNLPPLLWDESFSLLFQKGYVGSLWSQACGIVEWVLDSVSLAPEHTLFTTNEHNSKHLLGCYCMLASLLSTFNILTHLTLLTNCCDGCYHYLHFIDGDTEARSCNEPCSRSYR